MSTAEILGFALAALLLNLSPGPSVLFVMTRGAERGARSGTVTALGTATGSAAWAVLSGLGVAALLRSSDAVFLAVRLVGAAYLLYLGISGLRDANLLPMVDAVAAPSRPGWGDFLQGLLVETLNPKTIVFFLALVPSLVNQIGDESVLEATAVCLIVPLTALPVDLSAAVAGGRLRGALAASPHLVLRLNQVASIVLIGLAVWIAIDG
jgi:threonine/homoserine/homoserine lactone efflux protein